MLIELYCLLVHLSFIVSILFAEHNERGAGLSFAAGQLSFPASTTSSLRGNHNIRATSPNCLYGGSHLDRSVVSNTVYGKKSSAGSGLGQGPGPGKHFNTFSACFFYLYLTVLVISTIVKLMQLCWRALVKGRDCAAGGFGLMSKYSSTGIIVGCL